MKNQQQINALAEVLKNHEPYSKGWHVIMQTIRNVEKRNWLKYLYKVIADKRFNPQKQDLNEQN